MDDAAKQKEPLVVSSVRMVPAPSLVKWLPPEIWLTGPICCGKDTVAKALERFGYERKSIGELVAAELEEEHGLAPGSIYKDAESKSRWRTALQLHGNYRREQDPDYWLKAWSRWAEDSARRDTSGDKVPVERFGVINTSCRFVREAHWASARGAMVVRIETPLEVRKLRIVFCYPDHRPENDADATERELSLVPYHVQFPGTLRFASIPFAFLDAVDSWQGAGKPMHNLQADGLYAFGFEAAWSQCNRVEREADSFHFA